MNVTQLNNESPIEIIEMNGRQMVSARELYEALGMEIAHWSRWQKKNISDNRFAVENEDYYLLTMKVKNSGRGRPSTNYVLSIDFAKKICMMARTEKGEAIRDYFVRIEKKYHEERKINPYELLQNPDNLIQLLTNYKEEQMKVQRLTMTTELQEEQLTLQAPKVEYFDTVMQSTTTYVTNVIAKELGMSAITLNKKLRDKKVQYRQDGTWLLYSRYQDRGYTKTRTHTYVDSSGQMKTNVQTVWTEKGREFIHSLGL